MRLKFLLFYLLLSGSILNAQDTIRTLIISEALVYRADYNYIELTNIGTDSVQMSNFKLGMLGPWQGIYFEGTNETWLPDVLLGPGESYVIATVLDFTEKMHPIDPDNFGPRVTPKELWDLADWQIHTPETNSIPGIDSISPIFNFMGVWDGRDGWYIEQHLSDIDSVVVDQVNGHFSNEGANLNEAYDVAGVIDATVNSVLVRRFDVVRGNATFVPGVGLDDSEWIPIPLAMEDESQLPWRSPFWTVGNHGDYNFDENTLKSDVFDVDLGNKTITVPWGTRQYDHFMTQGFEQTPGIGWFYHLSIEKMDSAYVSVRNGDQITIYVCGLDLDMETFDLVLSGPTADANSVIPMHETMANGFYDDGMRGGNSELFNVTMDAAGMDTITNGLFGIGYATRVDTLLKYLEKAPKASWEIIWVDGIERSDVKSGDILKVTAENGDVKDYYIKVNGYRPNHNAYLSSITWPDMPEWMKGLFGWIGDTIPGFGPTAYNYVLQVPLETEGIPALVAKAQELNSKVEVSRAASINGTEEQRKILFTVTAEDDTTINVYNVLLNKERNPVNTQPFFAEPFLSELVFQDIWANGFVEICNPGNQYLDLSNYMFTFSYAGSPAGAIEANSSDADWGVRYMKYIPGYKWVDEATWAVAPGTVVQDLNVSAMIEPGGVFVAGQVADWSYTWRNTGGNGGWTISYEQQADVLFNTANNPWNESYDNWPSAAHEWVGADWYLYKILNDSIKTGLKPANDPADFELIEVFGMGDGSNWDVAGFSDPGALQGTNYIRKPEYSVGKPSYKESFGTNADDSEWSYYDLAYWQALGVGWGEAFTNCMKDIGKHFMNEVTNYKSTVSSVVYKVSEGYKWDESIKGMVSGTTVSEFLGNIIKADDNQTLKVKALADGSDLLTDAVLSINDTLIVMSADSTNITKYILEVSEAGLSANALLTSSKFDIEIQSEPKSTGNDDAGTGTIKGFDYGTALNTVIANITVPAGATMDIIDGDGAYVPLKMINFDTAYVNVTVNDNIFFNVVAENGVTTIVYQLIPNVSQNAAFITSNVYFVVQKDVLIHYVPRGTTVQSFLSNLFPSAGATLKLVDKLGMERMDGAVADDDKVIVTSPNGLYSTVYLISMLAEEFVPTTTYLAYILSNSYGVDQVNYVVSGVSGTETLAEFYSNITTSMGATAVVVDVDGNEKTTGDIDGTDMIKVTSVDGKIVVMYSFGQLTASEILETNNIELYPNPTNGRLNISGMERGNRIQVFNSIGVSIRDINAESSIESISLQKEPAGMYMIVISDNNKLLGRYKAIKY